MSTSLLAGFFLPNTGSVNIATLISRCLFSIPFLYVLFKKTGITVYQDPITHYVSLKEWLSFSIVGFVLGSMAKMIGCLLRTPSASLSNSQDTLSLDFIAYIFAVLIVAPVIEELFFRKWMISYLERKKFKTVFIILISSIVFFLGHISWTNNIFRLDSFIFGVVMCCIYIKYRDIRLCIFVHFINNLTVNIIGIIIHHYTLL